MPFPYRLLSKHSASNAGLGHHAQLEVPLDSTYQALCHTGLTNRNLSSYTPTAIHSMSGLLLVFSEPGPSIPKEEFDEWYDDGHIPPRTRVPSFGAVTRWTAADSLTPTYAAFYDLATPEAINDPLHTALLTSPDEREKSIMSRIALMDIRVYALHEPVYPPRAGSAFDVETAFKSGEAIVSIVEVDVPPEVEEEFNRWYDEEHIPLLMRVPQWIRSRRFVLRETRVWGNDEGMKARREEEKVRKYLAVHEYANMAARETEEFKATDTPWMKELMPKLTRFERRLMTFHRGWSELKSY